MKSWHKSPLVSNSSKAEWSWSVGVQINKGIAYKKRVEPKGYIE